MFWRKQTDRLELGEIWHCTNRGERCNSVGLCWVAVTSHHLISFGRENPDRLYGGMEVDMDYLNSNEGMFMWHRAKDCLYV